MSNVLYLTEAQVSYLAGVGRKDVRKRTRAKPGDIPLTPLAVPGIMGACFEATNVAAVYPDAAKAVIAALTK